MVKPSKYIVDQQRKIYYTLFVVFAVLIVLGLVNVFSSTFVADRVETGNTYYHLIRQIFIILLGAGLSFVAYKMDYHHCDTGLRYLCIMTGLFLVLVLVAGVNVNGAKRWLGYGPAVFQPSELAKLAVILYAASYLAPMLKRGERIHLFHPLSRRRRQPWWKHLPIIPHEALWFPLFVTGMVALQPDMGTAGVILAIPSVMVFISGARLREAKWPLLAAAGLILVYTSWAEYRRNRLVSWLDPWSYEQTLGYQTVQGLIAIGSGGITGQGVGSGVSKFSYLPEAHTDFAFAIFAQEWGLIGSAVMLGAFVILVIYGMSCALQTKDAYGMMLAVGVTMYLGGQGFINIGMVCGLLPVVGVPLPFISYGGTSLLINMIAAALLLNVAKRNWRQASRVYQRALEQAAPAPPLMKEETRSRFIPR